MDPEAALQAALDDFGGNANKISKKISEISQGRTVEEKRAHTTDAARFVKKATQCLATIDAEMKSLTPQQRRKYADRVQQSKQDLQNLKRDLDSASASAMRSELLGSASEQKRAQRAAEDEDLNRKAARVTAKAKAGTSMLADTERLVGETEEVGHHVVHALTDQRETLLRSNEKVQDISSLADTAKGIIQTIQRRAITNKVVLSLIVVLLLGVDIALLYFFYIK